MCKIKDVENYAIKISCVLLLVGIETRKKCKKFGSKVAVNFVAGKDVSIAFYVTCIEGPKIAL